MAIDFDQLKRDGFLKQRQQDTFIVRFRSLAGNLTSNQLRELADLADRYGRGYVHVTTRQGAEIPWVDVKKCNRMNREIKTKGLNPGASGPRIRTVTACPGNEVCRFGIMNSRATACELDAVFFGRSVPIKTKISVTGCPNSCAKPQENDIGLAGAVEPVLSLEKCTGCGVCQKVCPNKAISMVEGKAEIDQARCLLDGKCLAVCPTGAWQEKRRGYTLYAGGKIGRKPRLGRVVARFVQEHEATNAVEQVLAAFEALAQKGERVADVIDRVSVEDFRAEMKLSLIEAETASPVFSRHS